MIDGAKIEHTGTDGSKVIGRIVRLSPQVLHSHTSTMSHLLRFSPCKTLVRVTFKNEQLCLVNYIALGTLSDQITSTTKKDEVPMFSANNNFSYKLYISKDGKKWIKLFDYTEYRCHRIQVLQFPALAFRYE